MRHALSEKLLVDGLGEVLGTNTLARDVPVPSGNARTAPLPRRVRRCGTIPGVIAGLVVRVELLPGPRAFAIVSAAVLVPLGSYLALHVPPTGKANWVPSSTPMIVGTALVVGTVGGQLACRQRWVDPRRRHHLVRLDADFLRRRSTNAAS